MSVNPGFGGQSFIEAVIPKIRQAAAMTAGRDVLLQVDGGVDKGNVRKLVDSGIDVFVAGSSIFGKADPAAEVREMLQIGTTQVC